MSDQPPGSVDPNQTQIIGGTPQPDPAASSSGDQEDERLAGLRATSLWTDEAVQAAGLHVIDVPIVSIGGGLGSFALADTLRIAGLPKHSLRVLGNGMHPIRTYRYLAANSQIPDGERLRSDAGSTMDNIWGFPSYAFREAASDRSLRPLGTVFSEPLIADYYTPRAGQVYESVGVEAERIGWSEMLVPGVVRSVRRRHGGGYFSLFTPASTDGSQKNRVAYRSRHVHIAVGYPGVKFLPDLQAYREKHRDFSRVVNAYEPHGHVYEELLRRPSTVVVRGSGIVASRILQRLLDDRESRGAQTTVLHLFRNYVDGPQGDKITYRRPGKNGWAYQGFNFPKAAWGGQIKNRFEKLDGPGRAELLKTLGGTNTPPRKDWQQQLELGRAGGWYREFVGSVDEVEPGPDQSIVSRVKAKDGNVHELRANFIIDATGLEADIGEHRLLGDLLHHTGAQRSAYGRLEVNPNFELVSSRSEPGRLYASGSITLGGHYAGVDSFLGLQYAALRIADDLATVGSVKRIGAARSTAEWWRWFRKQPPKEVAA